MLCKIPQRVSSGWDSFLPSTFKKKKKKGRKEGKEKRVYTHNFEKARRGMKQKNSCGLTAG
jgi:hypothetical protein